MKTVFPDAVRFSLVLIDNGEAKRGLGFGLNPHLPPSHLWDLRETDEEGLVTSSNTLSHQKTGVPGLSCTLFA